VEVEAGGRNRILGDAETEAASGVLNEAALVVPFPLFEPPLLVSDLASISSTLNWLC